MSDRADQIQINKINTESPTIHSVHPSGQFWEAHPMVQSRPANEDMKWGAMTYQNRELSEQNTDKKLSV